MTEKDFARLVPGDVVKLVPEQLKFLQEGNNIASHAKIGYGVVLDSFENMDERYTYIDLDLGKNLSFGKEPRHKGAHYAGRVYLSLAKDIDFGYRSPELEREYGSFEFCPIKEEVPEEEVLEVEVDQEAEDITDAIELLKSLGYVVYMPV